MERAEQNLRKARRMYMFAGCYVLVLVIGIVYEMSEKSQRMKREQAFALRA